MGLRGRRLYAAWRRGVCRVAGIVGSGCWCRIRGRAGSGVVIGVASIVVMCGCASDVNFSTCSKSVSCNVVKAGCKFLDFRIDVRFWSVAVRASLGE